MRLDGRCAMKRLVLLLALAFLAVSCSDSEERTGTAASALSTPALTPLPKGPNNVPKSAWDRSPVELLVADAWTQCMAANPQGTLFADVNPFLDREYWNALAITMGAAICPAHQNLNSLFAQWFASRKDPACNFDPSTLLDAGVDMTAARIKSIASQNGPSAADRYLMPAEINYCKAQRLRNIAPGAAGGETLLYSAADQRLMLEFQREFSQDSVLDFGHLTAAIAAPATSIAFNSGWIQDLRTWAQNQNIYLGGVGNDFAGALHLLTLAGGEAAELMGRSASAKASRGTPAPTSAEEEWGVASWRQRALALLYGGDPLAVAASANAPWTHPLGIETPGDFDWPTLFNDPYVKFDGEQAEVSRILGLARSFLQAIELKVCTNVPTCKPVKDIDLEPTATRFYQAVEAALRTQQCTEYIPNTTTCKTWSADDVPVPGAVLDDYLLWSTQRVTPSHARTAIAMLTQSILNLRGMGYETVPVLDFSASVQQFTRNGELWFGVRNFKGLFRPTIEQREGPYAPNGTTAIFTDVFSDAPPEQQGFENTPFQYTLRRRLGVVGTLLAVREELVTIEPAMPSLSPGPAALLQARAQMLGLIGGAAGNSSVAIVPKAVESCDPGCVNATVRQDVVGTSNVWAVLATAPATDDFWSSNTTNYTLWIVPDTGIDGTLVNHPETTSFTGKTLTGLMQDPGAVSAGVASTLPVAGLDESITRWRFDIPVPSDVTNQWAVFVQRTINGTSGYRLLASNVRIFTGLRMHSAHFYGGDGSLNVYARKIAGKYPENPIEPEFDGFGLLTRLVPPTDPTILGASAGQNSTTVYLQNATSAAQEATVAIKEALEALLEQQKSQAATATAQLRANAVIRDQQKALCGESNDKCDTRVVETDAKDAQVTVDIASVHTDCTNQNNSAGVRRLACTTETILNAFGGDLRVRVAAVVLAHQGDGAQPSFSEYAGGSLQTPLIEQWAALRKLRQALHEIFTAYQAAFARIGAAETALSAATEKINRNCDANGFAGAMFAGMSMGVFPSFSPGPLIQQQFKCTDMRADLPIPAAHVVEAFAQAISEMTGRIQQTADASRDLELDNANINQLTQAARLASQEAALEAQITAATQFTSFLLYRRYHSYDMWRAKALLDGARRYALVARRSIEGRYVVNLSKLRQAEPFVASPATWADQIYDYDLNLPAAVGLNVGPQDPGGIYPNKVLDYVGNLGRFVTGVGVARPSATAKSDVEVLSLPGPFGLDTGVQLPNGVVRSERNRWAYFCPSNRWVGAATSGDPSIVCGGPSPVKARYGFSLDPWGRVDNDVVNEPYQKRYNARWTRLAVNLVGTGILDCTQSSDPINCYTQAFLRYDLTHVGPAWTTNSDQAWRILGVPLGRIEGAKALAAEQWLDPLGNGWSKPYVEAVGRTEFAERPFGGGYELVLQTPTEVRLSRIERIQILLESNYWVSQK